MPRDAPSRTGLPAGPPVASAALAAAALLAALLGAMLAGCTGAERQSTRFYVLDPLPAQTPAIVPAGAAAPPVDVAAVRLPRYLQRPQIVTRAAGNEIVLAEYHQWGGSLAGDLQRVLARNLSRLLDTPAVALFPRRTAGPGSVRVEVEVLEFERGADARVRLGAQWRVQRDAGVVARIDELVSEPLALPGDMDATVTAMSALWAELAARIAATVAARGR